jgi:hypothetical protein
MKKIVLLLSLFSLIGFTSCSEDETNNVNETAYLFKAKTTSLPVFETQLSEATLVVGVTTTSDVARTFSVEVDAANSTATAAMYTLPSTTVTIPAGSLNSTVKIVGNFAALPAVGARTVALKISGSVPTVTSNATNVVSLFRACATNPVTLAIVFDGYASEIGWTLTQNPSTVLATVAPTAYADGLGTFSQNFCLPAGSYTFTIVDTYGDGLSYPSNGTYKITHNNGTVLVTGGGDFGTGMTHTFTVN